ncbi:MAG: DUF4160 domain-containing protein [Ignavibacteriae bacterium]|nr:DUF4160 domain-containing protein [Ignavibacteriota bacterium]
MPEICRFYGIVIAMYFDEHNPPHFHARYGEYNASILINDFSVREGWLPPKALGLVIEWASQHKEDLLMNWNLAANGKTLHSIEPL